VKKKLRLHVIDAAGVAKELGLGGRINTIMQSAFFALSGVLPREEALARIKDAIRHSYEKKGPELVKIDASFEEWIPARTFTFPNGIAIAEGEPFVYVADFRGLSRIEPVRGTRR
jgi:Pyruvate/2-oxoacid:ferredoxin oxidoreductase gamma subunit